MKLKRIQRLVSNGMPIFYRCVEVREERDGTVCADISHYFGKFAFTVKTKKKGIDKITQSLILKASLRIEDDDYWLACQNPEVEEYAAWLQRT